MKTKVTLRPIVAPFTRNVLTIEDMFLHAIVRVMYPWSASIVPGFFDGEVVLLDKVNGIVEVMFFYGADSEPPIEVLTLDLTNMRDLKWDAPISDIWIIGKAE